MRSPSSCAASPGLLELGVGFLELVGARAVLADEARRLDGDGHLIGEGAERGQLALELLVRAQARLDVERADGGAGRRRWARTPPTRASASAPTRSSPSRSSRALEGDQRLAGLHHALGDGARELCVRIVAGARARGVHAERAVALHTSSTKPRSAEQLDGVIGDPRGRRSRSGSPASSALISRMRASRSSSGVEVRDEIQEERRRGVVMKLKAGRGLFVGRRSLPGR